MKKLALMAALALTMSLLVPASLAIAHVNQFALHPLAGEYTVSVTTTNLGNNSWIFRYAITNNTQEGDWTTPTDDGSHLTDDGLPPDWMNHIDFTGLTNFFVKVPHGAVVSNVVLPESYGESHGVNPGYLHEWHMQGPWQENPGDLYDWIMIYPYGFAEIYPRGQTLTFSFQIDGAALGVNQGQISTYYPDHQARSDVYEDWYDCYSLRMISPILMPAQQMEQILAAFDDAVSGGYLAGDGPGSSASGKLKAFGNMLDRAGEMVGQGRVDGAIRLLEDAYRKVDGNPRPPDFVIGSAASTIAERIQTLIGSLRAY
jgi:hypothetical protein